MRGVFALNPLWSNIFRKKPEEESLACFLGTVPVFGELGDRDLVFLESMVHVRHYSAGETVFDQGDTGSGMYIIRTGSVQIFSRDEIGHEEELVQLGPGDFFGETTLTAPATRPASARTLEASELVGLFRADLMETVQKHPLIANRILLGLTRVVSERLQAVGQEVHRLRRAPTAAPAESEDI